MVFRVTLKDPDGPEDAITDAARDFARSVEGIDDDEREQLEESRIQNLREFVGMWLRYGEYAEIEFDTEAGTARLLKAAGTTGKSY